MKAILVILSMLTSLTFTVAGDSINEEGCTRLYELSGMNLEESVHYDLLHANWIMHEENGKSVWFSFHENGIVDRMDVDGKEETGVEQLLWTTAFLENRAWLIIENPAGDKTYYRLNQTCEGIELLDLLDEKSVFLEYYRTLSEAEMVVTRLQVIGKWTSANPFQFDESLHTCPGEVNGSTEISWTFDEDGRFHTEVATDESINHANGVWELSTDGKYLLLYFLNSEDPEDVATVSVLCISQLTFEDFVSFYKDLPEELGLGDCGQWKAVHYRRV
jgi:hypothetical protein